MAQPQQRRGILAHPDAFEAGPASTRPPAGRGSWMVRSSSRPTAIVSLVLGLIPLAAAVFVVATAIIPIGTDPASCGLAIGGMTLPILLGSAAFPFALMSIILGAISVREQSGLRAGSILGIVASGLAIVVPLGLVLYFWTAC